MSQEPRIKQGIQFIQTGQINGELRIIGEDDAAPLLWAAQCPPVCDPTTDPRHMPAN
jgi:hypothetical protein